MMGAVKDHRRPHGIDVSRWNNPLDVHGFDFVFIRASSGSETDPKLSYWVNKCKRAGVPFGLYHFCYNSPDPAIQANVFATAARSVGGALHRGNIGLVVDCEGELSPAVAVGVIHATKALVKDESRHEVGIYSGGWVKSHGGGRLGADFGWLAQWGPVPVRPAHWTRDFLRFWQYRGAPLDLDVFMGTRNGFARWLEDYK